MVDILAVDLQARNADKANAAVTRYRENLTSANQQINDLGSRSSFAKNLDEQIAKTTARINEFRATLRDASTAGSGSGSPFLKGFGAGADQAAAKARALHSELRDIQARASKAVPGFPLFDSLQARAQAVGNELDQLERKAARVAAGRGQAAQSAIAAGLTGEQRFGRLNLARQGADVFTQVGSGQSAGLIAIQQGPQILEALAQSGLKIGVAGAGIAAGIAAIGAATIAITSQVRDQAEKRLATEEKITVEWSKRNKEIAEQKKKIAELNVEFDKFLAKQRKDAAADPALRQALGSLPVQLAQRNVNQPTLAQLKDLNTPLNEAVKQNQNEFKQVLNEDRAEKQKAIDRYVNSLQSDIAKAAAKGDRNALINLQKEVALQGSRFDSSTRLDFRDQFDKAFSEAVEKGKTKAKELGDTWKATFNDLFAARGANNPFVRVFTEADAAIDKVRKSTVGLSDDLRAQAEQMQRTLNANTLFTARLDSALRADDLRSDADRFRAGRGGQSTAQADAQLAAAIARRQAEETGGLFRNPATLGIFARGASQASQLALFDFQRSQERAGGLFRNPDIERFDREQLARSTADDPNASVQERLNRQLEILDRMRPENDAQRSEVDRRIIALTQGLNPDQLTDSERNAAAQARENEAVRTEKAEAQARQQRADQFKVSQNVDKNIEKLLKLAESEGLTGVIRIINEAEDRAKVSLGKRPSPSDTAAAMAF